MFYLNVSDELHEVDWNTTKQKLIKMFDVSLLKEVTENYFTIDAIVFNNLYDGSVGFHYNDEKLNIIEIFKRDSHDDENTIIKSFEETQKLLKSIYGNPSDIRPRKIYFFETKTEYEYHDSLWVLDQFRVHHYMMERYGPEFHLKIHRL